MKETKLKEDLSQVYDRFFRSSSNENNEIDIPHNQREIPSNEEKSNRKEIKKVFNILRQVFLFFPATFFTFFIWMGLTIFGLPPANGFLFILIMLLSPVVMVLGLGDIKNLKNWLSPLSVMVLGLLFGLIPNLLPFSRSFFLYFGNVIFLFPLALITAVLAKNYADSLEKKALD